MKTIRQQLNQLSQETNAVLQRIANEVETEQSEDRAKLHSVIEALEECKRTFTDAVSDLNDLLKERSQFVVMWIDTEENQFVLYDKSTRTTLGEFATAVEAEQAQKMAVALSQSLKK